MGTSFQQRPSLAASSFLKKLTAELQRKLQKALDTPKYRGELLRDLFTDVALEVDHSAQARLYSSDQVVDDGDDGDDAPETATGSKPPLCFYEVFAQHLVEDPNAGKKLLPLFLQMWSQSFASQIFALLFYRWLFEVPREESEGLLRYSTAFVEGASNIFWLDVQSNERRFFSLFNYALEEVVMVPNRLDQVSLQACQELTLLISRYFFFYEPADKLEIFLRIFPKFPNLAMGPADVFVIEVTHQLQKVKVEPVLLLYLHSIRTLKGAELWSTTSMRLKTALYAFTAPGGPMYTTRAVRHTAWETLDVLFPVGRHSRHVIALLFRLLHPFYWPFSICNFVMSTLIALCLRILGFLFDIFNRIRGSRHVPSNPRHSD